MLVLSAATHAWERRLCLFPAPLGLGRAGEGSVPARRAYWTGAPPQASRSHTAAPGGLGCSAKLLFCFAGTYNVSTPETTSSSLANTSSAYSLLN